MEFLVRLVQMHESFRKPELQALAELQNIDIQFLEYSESSPYCVIRLPSASAARSLVSRAILTKGIYELWGTGLTYSELHASIVERTSQQWALYASSSFRFNVDTYRQTRTSAEELEIVNSFSYLGFDGPILMRNSDEEFRIFEEYAEKGAEPKRLFFGRWVGPSGRNAVTAYSLKKRRYISTTSMDAEIALLTANLTLAGPGKLMYDPFVGTGSLTIACAHFGAQVWGSDIDGRTIRGNDRLNVRSNFAQYGLGVRYMGGFVGDLTHSPLRGSQGGLLDGIVCDPPYGVREGLRVLGSRNGGTKEVVWIGGVQAHLRPDYVPPKRPYSFEAMLMDILGFAADTLVVNGRISLWMPTANEDEQELEIPTHGALELVSVCVQPFNKWSRRLLAYRRRPEDQVIDTQQKVIEVAGCRADDLNLFRKKYFQGFKSRNDVESKMPT